MSLLLCRPKKNSKPNCGGGLSIQPPMSKTGSSKLAQETARTHNDRVLCASMRCNTGPRDNARPQPRRKSQGATTLTVVRRPHTDFRATIHRQQPPDNVHVNHHECNRMQQPPDNALVERLEQELATVHVSSWALFPYSRLKFRTVCSIRNGGGP